MDKGKNIFADRLRATLSEKRWTQKELADKVGVSPRTINSYVAGNSLPTMDGLNKICAILNVSADFLIGITNEYEEIKEGNNEISDDVLIIRRAYVKMSEKQRKTIIDLVKSIVEP